MSTACTTYPLPDPIPALSLRLLLFHCAISALPLRPSYKLPMKSFACLPVVDGGLVHSVCRMCQVCLMWWANTATLAHLAHSAFGPTLRNTKGVGKKGEYSTSPGGQIYCPTSETASAAAGGAAAAISKLLFECVTPFPPLVGDCNIPKSYCQINHSPVSTERHCGSTFGDKEKGWGGRGRRQTKQERRKGIIYNYWKTLWMELFIDWFDERDTTGDRLGPRMYEDGE